MPRHLTPDNHSGILKESGQRLSPLRGKKMNDFDQVIADAQPAAIKAYVSKHFPHLTGAAFQQEYNRVNLARLQAAGYEFPKSLVESIGTPTPVKGQA
jgi:hypothetical protein